MRAASLQEIEDAARLLQGSVARTPLVPLRSQDERDEVWLKLETLQPIGSFKLRGVYHAVARLSAAQRRRGECLDRFQRASLPRRSAR